MKANSLSRAPLPEGEDFLTYLKAQQARVQNALSEWYSGNTEKVVEAACYSLLLPSKRLRPLFCLETCRALVGSEEAGLPAAVALEMVHTYSLIHDDLPAMDNDDLRRGKPTNHKVFGEATALLAGSALLTSAFEVLSKAGDVSAETRVAWVRELSEASGVQGMVLGQHWDMDPDFAKTLEGLEALHKKKTGALLAASVVMGAIAGGASQKVQAELREFSLDMGLAFQNRDDILDVVGGVEIGKPVLSDEKNSKVTYVSLLGLEGAKKEGERWYAQALDRLRSFDFPFPHKLEALTRFVVDRKS